MHSHVTLKVGLQEKRFVAFVAFMQLLASVARVMYHLQVFQQRGPLQGTPTSLTNKTTQAEGKDRVAPRKNLQISFRTYFF